MPGDAVDGNVPTCAVLCASGLSEVLTIARCHQIGTTRVCRAVELAVRPPLAGHCTGAGGHCCYHEATGSCTAPTATTTATAASTPCSDAATGASPATA